MMTTTEIAETTVAATTAQRFLEALGRGDFERLEALFAPDVWFRALLPRKRHESTNAPDTVATFREWYGAARDLQVLATDHHTMLGREFVLYRFLLRPDWAPEQWHVIEQVGFCRVKDGRISRLDLVCTGFFPVDGPDDRLLDGGFSPVLRSQE